MADEHVVLQKGNPDLDPWSGKAARPLRMEMDKKSKTRTRAKQLTRFFSSSPGQRWQDNTPVPAQDRRGGHNNPDNRFQRRVSDLQEPQLQRVGSRRPDVYPALLAVLLREYLGRRICGRLDGH